MSDPVISDLVAEIAAMRRAIVALALASPALENVVAELERQKQFELAAIVPSQASDQHIEAVGSKMQELIDILKSQL